MIDPERVKESKKKYELFNTWKTRVLIKLIKIQHTTEDPKLRTAVEDLISALKYAKRRDLVTILPKLNNLINEFNLTELIPLIDDVTNII